MALINGTPGNDTLTGTADDDTINGLGGFDSLVGGNGNDSVAGNNDDDVLTGGNGNDTLLGGEGGDFLTGGPGADSIDGGNGSDTVSYDDAPDGIIVDLIAGTAADGFGGLDTVQGIEQVFGSGFSDNLVGSEGGERLVGNTGADSLNGGGGGDTIVGGGEDDVLTGGGGDDRIAGESGLDRAIFSGPRGNYSVSIGIDNEFGPDSILLAHPRIIVTDTVGGDGQDTVTGTEQLVFADDLAVAPVFVTIRNAAVAEGNDGTQQLVFDVSLSRPAEQEVSVHLATLNGSALAGGDYAATTDTLAFAPGITLVSFAVPIIGDATVEPYETFTVVMSDPVGARFLGGIETRTATGTIANDDGLFSPTDDVASDVTSATLLAVHGSAQGNIETNGDRDFYRVTLQSGTTYFINEEGTATGAGSLRDPFVRVHGLDGTQLASNDDGGEGFNSFIAFTPQASGDFFIAAGGFSDALTGTYRLSLTTATDLPALTIDDYSVIEDDSGQLIALFTVTRSLVSDQAVTVTATTSSGTALAGQDFVQTSSVVTISGGNDNTHATFAVPILADTIGEGDETFTITLSSPVNAVLGGHSAATGLIIDDDIAPTLSVGAAQITEGNAGTSDLIFTISLSTAHSQSVTVPVSTINGSAIAGSDYVAVSTVATIPAGQTSTTIAVPVIGDTSFEIAESFLFVLGNPTGGAAIGVTGLQTLGTIANDDSAVLPTVNGSTLTGDGADNFLVGGTSNDSLSGVGGNDVVLGSAGSDVLLGGDGNDTAIGGDIVVVSIGGNEVVLPDDLETGNDVINLGAGTNFGFAAGGNDTMLGGVGNDLLAGEVGNDVIFGGDGDNALYGGDGNDAIQGGNGGDIVFGMFGDDSIVAFGGFDLLIEEPAAGGGNDFIDARDGGSQIFAGAGNDTIVSGNGDDFMLGESGDDRIASGDGNDALFGGAGNDTLGGGAGDDILIAEGGDDRLGGGSGNDVLNGGLGADVFTFPNLPSGADQIVGFSPVDDTVELVAAFGITAEQALASTVQIGLDSILTLPTEDRIIFVGVELSTLTAADFLIV